MASGERLGRFEIVDKIASGGMGGVFVGRDPDSGDQVAIKTLHAHLVSDPSGVSRFVREAEVYRKLSHPNIVRYVGSGIQQGTYYIVLERVLGKTLEAILHKIGGPLGLRRSLLVAGDLLAALAYAHEHGVVHRDLKPGNVMVTSRGQVKLLDFSVAASDDELIETSLGLRLGSYRYASPEQNQGKPVDARADLYSLGLLLWEMLTGRPALRDGSVIEVQTQQVMEGIPPPSSAAHGIPPGLDAVCDRLLRKYPNERYPSATAALQELRAATAAAAG